MLYNVYSFLSLSIYDISQICKYIGCFVGLLAFFLCKGSRSNSFAVYLFLSYSYAEFKFYSVIINCLWILHSPIILIKKYLENMRNISRMQREH